MPISQPSPSEQEICSVLAQLQLDAEGKPTSEGKQTLRRLFKLSCKALSKVNEVVKLVPPAAPYAPIVDVLLGVASVWPVRLRVSRDSRR